MNQSSDDSNKPFEKSQRILAKSRSLIPPWSNPQNPKEFSSNRKRHFESFLQTTGSSGTCAGFPGEILWISEKKSKFIFSSLI
jgi:hypothetical protein